MAVDLGLEREIQRLADAQNGDLTWKQLLGLGLTPAAVRHRVATRRLWPVFFSVYAVADPVLLPLARETGALLSLGVSTSLLSHRTAAAVHQLIPGPPDLIHVTLIARKARPRHAVQLHRVSRLHPADITTRHNLRLTTPARTLIDFATDAGDPELEHAFGEARAKHRLSDPVLNQALDRAPANHPGAARISRLLDRDPDSTNTRSKTERQLRRLIAHAGLPQPLANRHLHGYLVDFIWPDHQLILEADAYGTHGDPAAFERDRRRDQIHIAAGHTVIRITRRQLQHQPLATIARIAQALTHRTT